MDYTQQNYKAIKQMLDSIGVTSIDELFSDIPKDLRVKELNISNGQTEQELLTCFCLVWSISR